MRVRRKKPRRIQRRLIVHHRGVLAGRFVVTEVLVVCRLVFPVFQPFAVVDLAVIAGHRQHLTECAPETAHCGVRSSSTTQLLSMQKRQAFLIQYFSLQVQSLSRGTTDNIIHPRLWSCRTRLATCYLGSSTLHSARLCGRSFAFASFHS